MRNKIRFLGILLATGILVTAGLNTAAGGMHQMDPHLPERVVEFIRFTGGISGVTVLGRDYVLPDVSGTRIRKVVRKMVDETKEFFNGPNLEKIRKNADKCWQNLADISREVDFSLIFNHR